MNTATLNRTALACLAGALLAGASAFTALADYPTTILSDAPVGYWRLGDVAIGQPPLLPTGDVAANSGSAGAAGNGYYLYDVGHPVAGALAGSSDTAAGFDGWKSRVDLPYTALLNTTNLTVEMWLKITNTTGTRAVSPLFCRDTNSQRGFLFYAYNATTKWQFRTYAGGTARNISSTADVVTGVWTHVVGTHENIAGVGSVMRFYINGLDANVALTNAISTYTPNTAGPLRIGAGNTQNASGDYFWPGSIDEVAIYTNALSPAQVLAHYQNGTNASRSTPYETLVTTVDNAAGYWRFNEAAYPGTTSPVMVNSGSLGVAARGVALGVTNSAAPIPGVTNNVIGGVTGVVVGDANPALQMNGKGNMVGVPYSAGLNPTNFTIECWARLDAWAGSHQAAISGRNGLNTAQGYIIYAAPNGTEPRWEFWTGPGWQYVYGPNATIGQWAHLVGTYDSATKIKLFYVDGQLVGYGTGVTLAPNDSKPLRIGAGENETGGNFFLNGLADEAAVYSTALAPNKIAAHYQAARGTPPAATTAPSFVVNPVNTTNWAPYGITLSTVALGSLPMQVQWYHVSPDGLTTTAVPGGTNFNLTLNPSSTNDTGNYYLATTNSVGTAESTWAWVEVIPPSAPTLTVDAPPVVPVYVGGTAGFEVSASGTPPISYLLQSNSVTIAASTNSLLQIPKVQYAYSNVTYRVVVTNIIGATPSAEVHLSVLTAPGAATASVMTNLGPVSWWRLGDADLGPVGFDYWGGYPGTYVAAYEMFPGALVDDDDGAAQISGPGSHLVVANGRPYGFGGTTNFTLVTWAKADALSGVQRLFSNRSPSGGYGFGFNANNGLRFTAFGVVDVNASVPAFNLGQWYHLTCVRSNTSVLFYVDGVLKSTGTAANVIQSLLPLQLGGNNYTGSGEEAFSGQLDEAAIFNRALTGAEISALYSARYGALVAPFFTDQPVDANVFAGGTARFSALADGSPVLGYHWKSNGVAIPAATNTSLILPNVTLAMNGVSYSVTVTNRAGTTNAAALLSVRTATGFAASVVADNPEGYWRLNETAGPVDRDSWGAHNGADSFGVIYQQPGAPLGDPDTAAGFIGDTTSKIDVPYSDDLNNPTAFTVECWAKVTGGSSHRAAISCRDDFPVGTTRGFIIYATPGNNWEFWTGQGATGGWQTIGGAPVVNDQWTHLVGTHDGATKKLYVNGVLVASAAVANYLPNTVRPLRIGAGKNEDPTGDYFFVGDLDEVSVYGTALSAERVAYHYSLGSFGTNTPPFIVQQPASQSVIVGGTASLTVAASGSPVLTYQWSHGGSPILGAVGQTLTLTNVQFSAGGSYSVRVSNGVGFTNSASATLTVLATPTFANLTNDLVLHLRFDGDYLDTSGRTNDAYAPLGSPSFLPGRIGQGVHVATAPNTNYLQINDLVGDLTFDETVSFSVAFWVKYTGGFNDVPIIGNAVNATWQLGWVFTDSATAGQIEWSLVSTANTGTYLRDPVPNCPTINNDTWHNVLGVVDRVANEATVYVDGALAASWPIAGLGTLATGQTLTIGQDPLGGYGTATFDLDDLGIWRRTISSYEAAGLYAAGQQGRSFDTYGPVRLTLQKSGADLELSWQAGTLQQNSDLNNPAGWTNVPGASAPYFKVTPGAGNVFYRVKL
jgi:hypothetical protein